MGILPNNTVTVDAILTKKGRELMAKGQNYFKITKFALADDEIDYHLWNENHPSGSNYYGYAIEQMPLLEPIPDETQMMRYKLVSLAKDTTRVPIVTVSPTTIEISAGGYADIVPNTTQPISGMQLNSTLGYTCILHNSDAATLTATQAVATQIGPGAFEVGCATVGSQIGAGIFLSDSELAKSVFAVGYKFRVVGKNVPRDPVTNEYTLTTKLTIIGNETGGSATITLTVDASR